MDTFKHETKDIVYVGCTKLKWCAISYREVSYEYALNDLIQKRERLIESLNSKVLQPVFLKKGGSMLDQREYRRELDFV